MRSPPLTFVLFAAGLTAGPAVASAAAQTDAAPEPERPVLALVAHAGAGSDTGIAGGQFEWRIAPSAALVAEGAVFNRSLHGVALPDPRVLPDYFGPPWDTMGWILGGGVRVPFVPDAGTLEPYLSLMAGYAGGTSLDDGPWQRFALGLDLAGAPPLGFRLEGRVDHVAFEWSALGIGVGLRIAL